MGTIIVGIALLAILVWAGYSVYKSKKNGTSCGCGTGTGCGGCDKCH